VGINALNYAYQDYWFADAIFLVGAIPLETQTNLFLNHRIPGIRNAAKVIIVDFRASKGNDLFKAAVDEAISRKPQARGFVIDRRRNRPAVACHMSVTCGQRSSTIPRVFP
jgi:hypothetical protein